MIGKLFPASGFKPTPEILPEPGLVFGDNQLGYYGRVSSDKLITGDALAALCGLTVGTVITGHSTADWLKFAYGGKTLYVASLNYRNFISYNALNTKQMVAGKTVVINGKQYIVRLLTGGERAGGAGSEWNDLIYQVVPTAPGPLPKWDTFTQDEIIAIARSPGGKGASWTNSSYSSQPSSRVVRGDRTIADYDWYSPTLSVNNLAWRPVLELIP